MSQHVIRVASPAPPIPDPEVAALDLVVRALLALSPEERVRMLIYLWERFRAAPSVASDTTGGLRDAGH